MTNGKCASDDDCKTTAGSYCKVSNIVPTNCICKNGIDTCYPTGTCADLCTQYQPAVDALNTQYEQCSQDSDCKAVSGRVCLPADKCQKWKCVAGTLSYEDCDKTKICKVATPAMVSATLSDDKTSITVVLNTYASDVNVPCSKIFDKATSALLGSSAQCSASGTTMIIAMRGDNIVDPNTTKLTFLTSQTALVDTVSKTAFAGAAVSLTTCTNCAAPTASIVAANGPTLPDNIVKPCTSGKLTILLDGSRSFDSSGRALKTGGVHWEVTPPPGKTLPADFDTAIQAANAAPPSSALRLTLSTSDFTKVDSGLWTVSLDVTDFIGTKSSTFTKTINIQDSGSIPLVNILGGAVQTFKIATGMSVAATIDRSTVCSGSQVFFSWVCEYRASSLDIYAPCSGITVTTLNFVLPSVTATVGAQYRFTLQAVVATSLPTFTASNNVASVEFTAAASPLLAVIDGPTGDVSADAPKVTFDSSRSSDPDDTSADGIPSWDCYSTDNPLQKCPATAVARQAGALTLDVIPGALTTGQSYTIALTMSKGTGATLRTATASSVIVIKAAGTPTGRITRQCGWDLATNAPKTCPQQHARGDPLVLLLVPDDGFQDATIAWSVDSLTLDSTNSAGAATSTLVLKPSALTAVGSTLFVNATMTKAGASGTARIGIPIASPPKCLATTSCLSFTPAKPVVGDTVQLSTFSWDGTYSFEFGTIVDSLYTPADAVVASATYNFNGLPVGDSMLYACAIDANGGRTCQSVKVTVVVSSTAITTTSIANDLTNKYAVSVLSSANDPGVLRTGATQLAAMLQAATLQKVTLTSTINDSIQTSVEGLITTLLDPTTFFPGSNDITASNLFVTTANTLAGLAPKALAATTKQAMSDAVLAAIPSTKSINTVQAKSICAAISNSAPTTTATPAASRRRSLLAAATASSQYATVTSAVAKARAAFCANGKPGIGFIGSGSKSVFFSCAIETSSNLKGATGAVGPSAITSTRRHLLQAASGTIPYTLPSNYDTWCSAIPTTCGTTTSMTVTYYTAPADWYMDSVSNAASMPAPNNTAIDVKLASGVVEVGVGGRADICDAQNICNITVTIPITIYDPTRNYTCIWLQPSGQGVYVASLANMTSSDVLAGNKITCTTPKTGGLIVASYALPPPPEPVPSPVPSPLPSPNPVPIVPSPSPVIYHGVNQTTTTTNTTTTTTTTNTNTNTTVPTNSTSTGKVNLLTLNYTDSSTIPAGPMAQLTLRFNFNFDSIKEPEAKATFLRTVRVGIAYNLAFNEGMKEFKDSNGNPDITRVQIVGEPRPGSIIVDTKIILPASWNATQVALFTATAVKDPNRLVAGTILEGSVLSATQITTSTSSGGLSKGAIAGIVIGVVVGVALVALAVYMLVIRKNRQNVQPMAGR